MKCPICGGKALVIETRRTVRTNQKRRRKECIKCGHRFTTFVTEKLRDVDDCEGCAFIDLRYPNAATYPCDRCIRANPSDYYTKKKN